MDGHLIDKDTGRQGAGRVSVGIHTNIVPRSAVVGGNLPQVTVFAAAGIGRHRQCGGTCLTQAIGLVGGVLRQGQLAVDRHGHRERVAHTNTARGRGHRIDSGLYRARSVAQRTVHVVLCRGGRLATGNARHDRSLPLVGGRVALEVRSGRDRHKGESTTDSVLRDVGDVLCRVGTVKSHVNGLCNGATLRRRIHVNRPNGDRMLSCCNMGIDTIDFGGTCKCLFMRSTIQSDIDHWEDGSARHRSRNRRVFARTALRSIGQGQSRSRFHRDSALFRDDAAA